MARGQLSSVAEEISGPKTTIFRIKTAGSHNPPGRFRLEDTGSSGEERGKTEGGGAICEVPEGQYNDRNGCRRKSKSGGSDAFLRLGRKE